MKHSSYYTKHNLYNIAALPILAVCDVVIGAKSKYPVTMRVCLIMVLVVTRIVKVCVEDFEVSLTEATSLSS